VAELTVVVGGVPELLLDGVPEFAVVEGLPEFAVVYGLPEFAVVVDAPPLLVLYNAAIPPKLQAEGPWAGPTAL